MVSLMTISVIIPVYKVEAYIERCIKSVVTQEGIGTAYNLECILVDDCTPDNSMEIAKEVIKPYENIHFICLRNEVNSGVSVARNTGLEFATGEYIMFYLQDQPWLYSLVSHIDSMLLLPNTTYFYEEAPNSASHGALTPEKAQRYVDSWNKVFDYYLSHRPSSKNFKHNLEVDFLLYLQHTHLRAIMLFPYEKKDYNQILKFRDNIMSLALKDGRLIIACFHLLEYKPFIYLFKFKCFRLHYYYVEKIAGRIAHLFDFIHRKS